MEPFKTVVAKFQEAFPDTPPSLRIVTPHLPTTRSLKDHRLKQYEDVHDTAVQK